MAYNEKIKVDIDSGGSGQRTAKDINKATKAIKGAGASGRDATIFVQNFGEGLGDLQYGARNVANNVEIMAGSFTRMVAREGSIKGFFRSIGTALTGPAGILTLITILINYGPEIYQFFKDAFGSDTQKEVEANEKRVEELNKDLKETKGLLEGLAIKKEVGELTADSLEKQIKAIEDSKVKIRAKDGTVLRRDAYTEEEKKQLADLREKLRIAKESAAYAEDQLESELKYSGEQQRNLLNAKVRLDYLEKSEASELEILNQKLLINEIEGRLATTAREVNRLYLERQKILNSISLIPERGKVSSVNAGLKPKGVSPVGGGLPTGGKVDIEPHKIEETSESFKDLYGNIDLATAGILGFANAMSSIDDGGFKGFARSVIDTAKNIAMAMAIAAATKEGAKSGKAIALPALIALALGAVSSAFGKVKGGGGGGSTATGATVTYNKGVTNPTLSQGGTVGDRYIGELELRGDTLVVGLQAANETRSRY